jgi:hypothetical protein
MAAAGEQLARRAGLAVHDFGDVVRDFPAGFPRGFKRSRYHGWFWNLKQRGHKKVSASFHARAT